MKTLALKIGTDIDWYEVLGSGRLTRSLALATQLEQLFIQLSHPIHLGIDEPYFFVPHTGLVSQHRWEHLIHVSVAIMILPQQELLGFLKRHRQTLRHIHLWQIMLLSLSGLSDNFLGLPHAVRGRLSERVDVLQPMGDCGLHLSSLSLVIRFIEDDGLQWYHSYTSDT